MEQFLHDLSWVPPLRSPELTVFFNGLTWLGYTPFFLLFLPLGYWLWDKDLFTRLAVLIIITGIINSYLKDLFQDPRPALEFALDKRVGDSYGLPSGHAQVATAMWLWLAYELKRWWAWSIAIFIVAGVCMSRLYLGVHDPEDIIAGVVLGLFGMALFAVFLSDDLQRWHTLHPGWQIAIILALQPLLWLAWPGTKGPGAVATLGAFLIGWWGGYLYDRHRMDFKRHPNWLIALLAAVIGIGGVFLAFTRMEGPLMSAGLGKLEANYIQTLVIGVYVTAVAPFLFRMARMAK